jgi:hypothetical protein
LTVLKQGKPFPPRGFPKAIELSADDIVVDQQFVHVAR